MTRFLDYATPYEVEEEGLRWKSAVNKDKMEYHYKKATAINETTK
jgi:hypothetical protein